MLQWVVIVVTHIASGTPDPLTDSEAEEFISFS
jgi:hypothetical protein